MKPKILKTMIKIIGALLVIVVLVIFSLFFRFDQISKQIFSVKHEINISPFVKTGDLELGKRIYTVRNGCIDCHGEDLAGSKVMDDPAMGTVYGANISPYNLNSWSDDEIAIAIRYGVHKSGRTLRFMPAFDFEGLSKQDVASLIKYLRSVPPIEKPSHQNSFGPVAKILSVLGQMPVMFSALSVDPSHDFSAKPQEEASVDFGKYLVNSCVGCHGKELRGGKIPGGDPSWPEASNIRYGTNSGVNEEMFEKIITSGTSRVTGNKLRLPMPIAALQAMNATERKAIWLYLSSLN